MLSSKLKQILVYICNQSKQTLTRPLSAEYEQVECTPVAVLRGGESGGGAHTPPMLANKVGVTKLVIHMIDVPYPLTIFSRRV